MHFLITGGAGFIGSHLAAALAKAGHRVRVLDLLDPQVHGPSKTFQRALTEVAECRLGDLRDPALLAAALEGIDGVAHCAAQTGVGQSMYDLRSYVDVNVGGTAGLLESILHRGSPYPRVVLSSSRAVYGEGSARCPEHGEVCPRPRERRRLEAGDFALHCPVCDHPADPLPTKETHPSRPVSFYGWTKQAQEDMCGHAAQAFGVPLTVLRYFNVYGSHQSLVNPYTGLVNVFYNRLRAHQPLALYEGGRPSRDFVHVSDVVQATAAALVRPDPVAGVFNIGTGAATTIRELAVTLADVMRQTPTFEDRGAFRVGDIFSGVADIDAARTRLSYAPARSLREGLAEFVRWADGQPAQDGYQKTVDELKRRNLFGEGRRTP